MAKKKTGSVLAHLARVDQTMQKKQRRKAGQEALFKTIPYLVTSVFVIAESTEEVQKMIDEDWYGLAKRGFAVIATYQLVPLGLKGSSVQLPKTGCYETCQEIYRGLSD